MTCGPFVLVRFSLTFRRYEQKAHELQSLHAGMSKEMSKEMSKD